MLVHELKCFRYYSDFSGFDLVVILESDSKGLDIRKFLDDIIESWFQYPSEIGDIPLTEFIVNEFERKDICISIYFSLEDE
jgi:hypothetical protein